MWPVSPNRRVRPEPRGYPLQVPQVFFERHGVKVDEGAQFLRDPWLVRANPNIHRDRGTPKVKFRIGTCRLSPDDGGVLWSSGPGSSARLTFGPPLVFLQGGLSKDVERTVTFLRKTLGLQPSLSDGLANHVRRDS